MHTLYRISGIDFSSYLINDGNSTTYIKNNLWKYHYVLTYLLHKRRHTTYKDSWVKVSVGRLRKELRHSKMAGKNSWFIDRVRNDFVRWGIILRKYKKITGEQNKIYRISLAKVKDEIIALGWKEWLPNAVFEWPQSPQILTGVYTNIQRSLKLLSIDHEGAHDFTNWARSTRLALPDKLRGSIVETNRVVNYEVWSSWHESIKLVEQCSCEVQVQYCTSGRVFTVVTSFPRKLKPFLRLNGKVLWQLDCSCSQPLLFAAYLKRRYSTWTPDMHFYLQLVETGEFYSYLKQLLCFYKIAYYEDTFKGDFFAKIFYIREKVFGKGRRLFHLHFPGVSEAILEAKRVTLGAQHRSKTGRMVNTGGHPELLSNALSLLESEIMIEGVAQTLYAGGETEFLTVHDALLLPKELIEKAKALMVNEYQRHGVTPMIKVDELKPACI